MTLFQPLAATVATLACVWRYCCCKLHMHMGYAGSSILCVRVRVYYGRGDWSGCWACLYQAFQARDCILTNQDRGRGRVRGGGGCCANSDRVCPSCQLLHEVLVLGPGCSLVLSASHFVGIEFHALNLNFLWQLGCNVWGIVNSLATLRSKLDVDPLLISTSKDKGQGTKSGSGSRSTSRSKSNGILYLGCPPLPSLPAGHIGTSLVWTDVHVLVLDLDLELDLDLDLDLEPDLRP